jgi:hypothetical protein
MTTMIFTNLIIGLDYDELALLLETNSPLPVPNPLDPLDISAQAIRNMDDINESLPPTDTNLSGLDIELAISDIFSSTTDIESVETCQVNPTPSINPPQILVDTPISLEVVACTKISNPESVNAEIKGAETREVNPVPAPPTTMPAARCTDFSLALIWQDIASQTLLIPESLMQKEILDALDSLLRDAGRFYSCDLGENDERWGEYMELQKVSTLFSLFLIFNYTVKKVHPVVHPISISSFTENFILPIYKNMKIFGQLFLH